MNVSITVTRSNECFVDCNRYEISKWFLLFRLSVRFTSATKTSQLLDDANSMEATPFYISWKIQFATGLLPELVGGQDNVELKMALASKGWMRKHVQNLNLVQWLLLYGFWIVNSCCFNSCHLLAKNQWRGIQEAQGHFLGGS